MDFSYQNAELWNCIIQSGIIASAILFANLLRRRVPFIRRSMMPTSVIAGFVLLILSATDVLKLNTDFMEKLVYHCIALGFIAMSLRTPEKNSDSTRGHGAKSGAIIVGSYLVQAIVGLVITLALAYTVKPDMFKAAGVLLPMGYGQGPGQANNIGGSYEAAGFVGGKSFALAIAAAGYLCACVVGVIALNVWKSKGKIKGFGSGEMAENVTVDSFQASNEIPISESIDRFSVQIALVLLVYLATYLVTRGITSFLSASLPGVANTVNTLLWGFNFIIGSALAILLRVIIKKLNEKKIIRRRYQNNYLLSRISGLCFDFMIVCGIASINIGNLSGLWLPFILLAVAGALFTWVYLAWICKKVYKGYYYEGLIAMYGMMTGTISSGILLLRELDPDFKTPAANDLVIGSSFAIIFGAPMLVFVGMAINSTLMTFVTLGLCVVYFLLLLLYIIRVKERKGK